MRGRDGWLPVLLIALLVVAPVGCKRNPGGVPAVQGTTQLAIQAHPVPKGFALLSIYPDGKSDELAIALEFTQPLVGVQDFDSLLSVTGPNGEVVKGSWKLDDGARVLRFPFVAPAQKYSVHVSGRLVAADGHALGADLQREVYTGPLDPVVGFASQGSVLPARGSRGLPVVSVNVPEIDVEFFRVRDKQLSSFFAQYQRGGQRDGYELEASYDKRKPLYKMADSVYMNRFVLGGRENERVVSYLPIQGIEEIAKPGLYFAVMKAAGRYKGEYQTSLFFVSDIGLHVRAYKDKVFVHTASLQSGEAIAGVELSIIDKLGEQVTHASTDADGNALIAYTLQSEHVMVARRGSDTSMLAFNQPALDLSEFSVAGRKQSWFDVFTWSGRDLYRPGETVHLSALMRDYDGRMIGGPGKAGQPLFLTLKQPDGRDFLKTRIEPRALGYYGWDYAIPADAPTGRWQVEFRASPDGKDVVDAFTLRVEEFLPERMKLDLDSAQPTIHPGEPLKLLATAAYLYGAPADGNRFTARLTVVAEQHPVDALKDYYFGDPTISLPKDAKDIIDAKFDAQGKYQQDIALPDEAKAAKAPVSAIVSGSVYETGGRTVTRVLKRTLWPASALVGVRPLFDDKDGASPNANAGFEVLRVDATGKRLAAKGLKVTLVRERRDYRWTWGDHGWDYDFTPRYENVASKPLEFSASRNGKVDFPVEWGEYRLQVFDPETGLTSRYPFQAGWSWDDQNRGLDARPDKVKLALDKTSYRAGDILKVTVTPPQPGKGLLLVESDRLLHVMPIDARPGATFSIPVTAAWERHDVYVTALVFRGGSAVEVTTPARAVGVAHVPMDRANRALDVAIKVARQSLPERDLPVTIAAPQLAGKQAFVTVSAVDVGILNITRFPVPDPFAYFFAPRRLAIDAYDLYGRVIESYDGETAKLRFGGDMALGPLPQARRPTAQVQTVDLFAGPVALDARGIATVNVRLPEFNGTLRVSAVVFATDRFGKADAETLVRAPVVAEVSAPRVLAPGDSSTVTLDLQNFTGAAHEFTVSAKADAPLRLEGGARKLSLKDGAKGTLSFPLGALQGQGIGHYTVTAATDGFRVQRSYELTVRPAWPAIVRSRVIALDTLDPVTLDTSDAVGMMADSVDARLTLTALPPLPFASALAGLLDYPYGCAEQTTSKGWAALLLDADTGRKLGMTGLTDAERKRRVEGALGRLTAMQIPSGHFSMWGGDSEAVPQLTPYITEFLLDARDGGFQVPEAVLQKSLERLNEDLLTGGQRFYSYEHADALRFASNAYAGYVLARVNRAPLGTLRALYDNERGKALTPLPLMQLGVALDLMGDHSRGRKAVAEAFAMKSRRPWYLGDYGSDLRDLAMMVTLSHRFHLAKPEYDARILDLARDTKSHLDTRWAWLSTQEQIALAALGKTLIGDSSATVSGTLAIGGETQSIAPDKIWSRDFDVAALRKGVRFTPKGKPPLYALVDIAGVPSTLPTPDDSKISVVRSYYTTDGKEWKGGPLKEGDALIVGLKIESKEAVHDALIVDLLPAGVEIENFNLSDAKQWADVVVDGIQLTDRSSAATVKHEEFRDDRYVAAIDLDQGSAAHVFYLVRAVTPGTYGVPPPLVQDMYRPQIRGIGKSVPASIKVIQP
jgi:uncharacterized protein YfaS (alpha-2-macroglobulin family)